jgi:hypothetical protein
VPAIILGTNVTVPQAAALMIAAVLASAPLRGQSAPGFASDARASAALAALDRYLETWNSRDPRVWAASLHFPHVRPGPGAFEVSHTAEQYAKGVDFNATLATGWHHSEWTSRRVLQVGSDKVHVAGSWTRYTADGRALIGSAITYIVTNQNGRWGVLSRFAAGPTGVSAADATANQAGAREALDAWVEAWNSHEPQALAEAQHYPFVRIGDGIVDVWGTPAAFLAGPEPGRQRTWYETRLDSVAVAQVSANGANIAATYSRRGRGGEVMSQYDAVFLAVRRGTVWKIQAFSTMGP